MLISKLRSLLLVMALACGMVAMPTVSLADSAGASKCLKVMNKFLLKTFKTLNKPSVKACAAGGTDAALIAEMGAATAKVDKAIAKLVKKYNKLACHIEDPDLDDLTGVTPLPIAASTLANTYMTRLYGLGPPTLEEACDGIATP